MIFRAIFPFAVLVCTGVIAEANLGYEQQVSDQETRMPISSRTHLGFSGDEAIGSLFRNLVASLTWTDEMPGIQSNQRSTSAHFDFVPIADFVTVVSGTSPKVIIDGYFEMQSDDGKINVRCPIKLEVPNMTTGFVHTTPFINDGWYSCEELQNLAGPASENQIGILLQLSINGPWGNGSIIRQYIDETGWHNVLLATIW